MEPAPIERRPLATREIGVVKRIADLLAKTSATPNGISTAGLFAGLLAGACLMATARFPDAARLWWIAGAAFVQLRLAANMFDGMVAIRTGATSRIGELFNEVPDRISDAATLIGLGYAAGGDPALGYGAACMAIFVAYIRAMGKVAGADQEFCGPMAKPQRMFLATVVAVWCAATPLWLQSVAGIGVPSLVLIVILVGCVVTSVRRLHRIRRTLESR